MTEPATDKPHSVKKPPITDAQRHERFVETALEIEADEDAEAFNKAFARVVKPPKQKD